MLGVGGAAAVAKEKYPAAAADGVGYDTSNFSDKRQRFLVAQECLFDCQAIFDARNNQSFKIPFWFHDAATKIGAEIKMGAIATRNTMDVGDIKVNLSSGSLPQR